MALTKAYKLANYDKLARQAECDWLAVHILSTGEEYDLRHVEKVAVGEWLTGRVYRCDGAQGGILVLTHRVEGQQAAGRSLYLDDFLAENCGRDTAQSAGLPAYRNLADTLQIMRRRFFETKQPQVSKTFARDS